MCSLCGASSVGFPPGVRVPSQVQHAPDELCQGLREEDRGTRPSSHNPPRFKHVCQNMMNATEQRSGLQSQVGR